MADAIRAKDLPEKVAMNVRFVKGRAKKQALEAGICDFEGKVFADLTGSEKDDLLKVVAVFLGIIEE